MKVIIAAVLHDTIEDTDATVRELAQLFGSSIVLELTDDKRIGKGRTEASSN